MHRIKWVFVLFACFFSESELQISYSTTPVWLLSAVNRWFAVVVRTFSICLWPAVMAHHSFDVLSDVSSITLFGVMVPSFRWPSAYRNLSPVLLFTHQLLLTCAVFWLGLSFYVYTGLSPLFLFFFFFFFFLQAFFLPLLFFLCGHKFHGATYDLCLVYGNPGHMFHIWPGVVWTSATQKRSCRLLSRWGQLLWSAAIISKDNEHVKKLAGKARHF